MLRGREAGQNLPPRLKPPVFLLVEDSADDVFFMERALRHAHVEADLQIVSDGRAAQDYLLGRGEFANRRKFPLPDLMLLDLRLPLLSGLELLAWLREQEPPLKDLAVMVLTSSLEDRDMRRTFELGAASYLVKPPTAEMVEKAFRFVELKRGGESAAGATAPAPAPPTLSSRIFFTLAILGIVVAAGTLIALMMTR